MVISHLPYNIGGGGGVLPPVAPASEFNVTRRGSSPNYYANINYIDFSNNPNTRITIPEKIEINGVEYPVSFNYDCFTNLNTNLGACTELVIPFNIVIYCSKALTQTAVFKIPNQITTLRLNSLNVTKYGSYTGYVFDGVSLPRNIQELELGVRIYNKIPAVTFYNVTSNRTMNILNYIMNNNVIDRIGNRAFYYCTGLPENITFSNVNLIEQYAFASCTTLKSISFPHLTNISEVRIFEDCSSLETIDLGQCASITYSQLFSGTRLKHLYLRNESMMCSITFTAGTIPTANLEAIHVPASLLSDYQNDPNWSAYSQYFVAI